MMMMSVEQSAECLAGETKVLGENLPHSYFCPLQITQDLTQAQTRAVTVGIHQHTA
jgi:hypothetical protein